ncbi:hypothetical protein QBC38DRAFT_274561 [Podospora fimiseda]|uniref:SHSP domain-containing protein n=1 Tax=Podospora fimiseda TaxID=252190 RepID=A0AAN7H0K9_9PEZI|nr:hypothetical protein QBC38DRAFT_274561 [Podospora fimiseda]
MAWNTPPNNRSRPPPPYGANNQGVWDFMRSMNLNADGPGTGAGIDHAMPPPPPGGFPFPFGPSGGAGPDSFNPWFGGWGRRGGRHAMSNAFGTDNDGEASDTDDHHHHGRHGSHHGRGGRGGGGRHGRHNHEPHTPSETEEDLYDITAAAGAAEADLLDSFSDGMRTPSTSTMHGDNDKTNATGEHPDPPEEIPTSSSCPPGGRRGRGGRRGGFGRHPCSNFTKGPHHPPHHGHPHPPPPPPPPPFGGSFSGWGGFPGGPGAHRGGGRRPMDWASIMNNFGNYMKDYLQNYVAGQQQQGTQDGGAGVDTAAFAENEESFAPPADIFTTAIGWTIHLAIPGAKKQDIGVHWDADKSLLIVSGVVYRPGDEQFLSGMVSSERRVGLFERKIELPPAGAVVGNEKEEVDGNRIKAKLEDGVLVVDVGKAEKEWTEIKKVDIE